MYTMGLFSRKKSIQPIIENRDNEPKDSYTVPVGLDFLTPYLSKGEATAISSFFSGVQLISSTIASTPIHVRDTKTNDIIYHPIDAALNDGLLNKFNLMKQLIWDLYVYGNGLFYIKRASDGTPIELIYCPFGTYSIMYNQQSRKLYYLLTNISAKKLMLSLMIIREIRVITFTYHTKRFF